MSQEQKSNDNLRTRVHVWLTKQQILNLDTVARQTGLTRSFLLRDAITHWLETRAARMEEFIRQTLHEE
jgi:predicted transcriptional regulator